MSPGFRNVAYMSALLMILAGCASVGLAQPKKLSDRVAYAYGVNAGLRNAAANSINAQTLSSTDGEYVLNVSDQTRTLLDASKLALDAGDPKTAEGRLVLALNVLEKLQAYLNERVPK